MSEIATPAADSAAEAAQPDGRFVVSARDLSRVYGEDETAVHALRNVNLDVEREKLTAVMGPSGSGQVDAHAPARGTRPAHERLRHDCRHAPRRAQRHRGHTAAPQAYRFIFQFFNLLPMLSAEENILLPLSLAGTKPDAGFYDDLLGKVGLKDRRKHRPPELSAGEQQRVAIARALVSRPTVVFADEPTGNLDSRTGGEILELLRSSVGDYGQTLVMVTHDAHAAPTADRILFLADGVTVKELPGADEHEVLTALEEIRRT